MRGTMKQRKSFNGKDLEEMEDEEDEMALAFGASGPGAVGVRNFASAFKAMRKSKRVNAKKKLLNAREKIRALGNMKNKNFGLGLADKARLQIAKEKEDEEARNYGNAPVQTVETARTDTDMLTTDRKLLSSEKKEIHQPLQVKSPSAFQDQAKERIQADSRN